MKNKIFLFICAFALCFILLVIPSFADESRNVVLGYYPVIIDNSADFYLTDTFYILPKYEYIKESYIAYALSCSQGVVSFHSTIYYPDNYPPGSPLEDESFIMKYNSATHYIVADIGNSDVGRYVSPLEDDAQRRFFIIYPFTLNRNVMLRVSACIGSQSYHSPTGLTFSRYRYTSDGVYILDGLVDRFQLLNTVQFYYDYNSETFGPEYLSNDTGIYLQPRDSYSFGDFNESMYEFYCHCIPVSFPEVEQDPVKEVPLILIDFIGGIFDGLNSLYIFPGVSVMGLVFGIFGILIFRYIIKLLAGG